MFLPLCGGDFKAVATELLYSDLMCSNKRTRGTLSEYIFYITDLENCVYIYINVYIQSCAAMDGAADVLGIKCVKLETCTRHDTSCLILSK